MREIRQYCIFSFQSDYLKNSKYNIKMDLRTGKKEEKIINVFESQMIRSIIDIRRGLGEAFPSDAEFFELKSEKRRILKRANSKDNYKRLVEVQGELDKAMFISEYVVIDMKHDSHYDYMYENGIVINNKKYVRFSCSAGQARTKTVVFVEENMAVMLDERLDNGRDKNKPLTASKFNAYKGLASSASSVVTPPRFCVVPDIEVNKKLKAHVVTETPFGEDDIIKEGEVDIMSNLFDGMGLITPGFAEVWANDLEIDYLPAQFCIRQNFIKGMVCTFDIIDFCNKFNNGSTVIKSIYGKDVDLKDIDIILTESQFKLWDSFEGVEQYSENCIKNNLKWGVSLFTPKEDKDILFMNYQFIQTLNLSDEDVDRLCDKFIEWIKGVTIDNVDYSILYMLGANLSRDRIANFLNSSDDYWLKSLLVNKNVINDKYLRDKIYMSLKNRIDQACLGRIIVDGNFQVLVSDPFGLMQHVCGLEVTGLIPKDRYYSQYWNDKGVKRVNGSRSPLNYKSEHRILDLVESDELNYWFKYCYTGIILNIHGNETVHFGGSDFDYDILATTSDEIVIKGVDNNELPIYYDPPKPIKKVLTDDDLFLADKFGFGSIIGSITNKGSSAYALMANYGDNTVERNILENRVKMCTKLQSAQIDKAKIGRDVKGIPKSWVQARKVDDLEYLSEHNVLDMEMYNELLLNRHPYFFIYLYKDTMKKYKDYVDGFQRKCKTEFGCSLEDIQEKPFRAFDEDMLIREFERGLPVIKSNSVMNSLCFNIERLNSEVSKNIKSIDNDIYNLYMNHDIEFDKNVYKKVKKCLVGMGLKTKINNTGCQSGGFFGSSNSNKFSMAIKKVVENYEEELLMELYKVCNNIEELTNYMVHYYYVDKKTANKNVLWGAVGCVMFENVRKNSVGEMMLPVRSESGEIEYLGKTYSLERIESN